MSRPMNRKQRRELMKRSKFSKDFINSTVPRRRPAVMGVKALKRAGMRGDDMQEYKRTGWRLLQGQNDKIREEREASDN